MTYHYGDRFLDENDSEWMICQIARGKVALININPADWRCGNRWREGVRVDKPHKITKKEFLEFADDLQLRKIED